MTENERQAAMDLLEEEHWLDTVWSRMNQHIKHDEENKRIVFKVMASTFALEQPLNATLKASTSTGKTYLTVEIAKYMPPSHVEILEGMTPKAIYYEYGESSDGEGTRILNLSGRIWIFLDIPDLDTLRFIKAMMSHDAYERTYKSVDEQKPLKIILRGYACVIACTTSEKYNEEMSTRAITITPEDSQEKIADAIRLYYARCANPEFNVVTTDIQASLRLLAETKRRPSFPTAQDRAEELIQEIKAKRPLQARDMRDLKWLPSLAMVSAWLNQRHRLTSETLIEASADDWRAALEDWEPVRLTTTTGLTSEQLRFLAGLDGEKEYSVKELQEVYHETLARFVSYETLKRRILDPLIAASYLDSEPDPMDKRRILFTLIHENNGNSPRIAATPECVNSKGANAKCGNGRLIPDILTDQPENTSEKNG
jgi:DNA-binding MarR family transcriptional regulator